MPLTKALGVSSFTCLVPINIVGVSVRSPSGVKTLESRFQSVWGRKMMSNTNNNLNKHRVNSSYQHQRFSYCNEMLCCMKTPTQGGWRADMETWLRFHEIFCLKERESLIIWQMRWCWRELTPIFPQEPLIVKHEHWTRLTHGFFLLYSEVN